MKLKQILLSALAMVAVATGYAQDINSIVTADEGITVYDSNDYWELGNNGVSYTDWNNQGEYYYYLTFESESDIEVSFDVDVVIDNNATLMIKFDDSSSDMYLNYEPEGKHITHTFDAGEHTITFMYGRWDDMIIDPEWGTPELENQRAEIYNIMAKCLCQHEFPEVSEIPATCNEPSKSHCIKCGKLLSDGNSPANDQRLNTITIGEGVNAEICLEDKGPGDVTANPWEHVDESDPSKGLTNNKSVTTYGSYSAIYIKTNSEEDCTLSFDYDMKSEDNSYTFYVHLDESNELTVNTSQKDKVIVEIPKGNHYVKLSFFNYKWGAWVYDPTATLGDNGVIVSNMRLLSDLDQSQDGRIEVDDLTGLIESKRGIPGGFEEIKGKIEKIVDFILNKE